MEAFERLFTIRYPYVGLLTQRRVNALRRLNMFALLLSIGLTLVVLVTWQATTVQQAIMIIMPILASITLTSQLLLRNGRLGAASSLFIGLGITAALGLIAATGVRTPSVIALPAALFIAGLLSNRRGVTVITVIVIVGTFIIAVLDKYVLFRMEPSLLSGTLPTLVMLGFYATIQRLLVQEFHETIGHMTDVEQQLGAAIELSNRLARPVHIDVLVDQFANHMMRALGLQQVQVFLQAPENPGVLRLSGGAGLAAQRAASEGRSIAVEANSPIAIVYREQEHALIHAADLTHLRSEFLPGTKSQMLLPLSFGENTLGVVDLQSGSDETFSPDITTLIGTLMQQFAATVQSIILDDKLRQITAEQQTLEDHIQKSAVELQKLRRQASGFIWGRFFQERGIDTVGFDITSTDYAPVFSDRLTDSLKDALDQGQVQVKPIEGGYVLSLPITLRGEVLGAMEFELIREGDLPPRVVDMAQTIAERLSMALDNVRLVEQTRAFARREQQISNISSRLQGTSTMEDLLNLAVQEFNTALGSEQTQIRLQLYDTDAPPTPRARASEGGAS